MKTPKLKLNLERPAAVYHALGREEKNLLNVTHNRGCEPFPEEVDNGNDNDTLGEGPPTSVRKPGPTDLGDGVKTQ